MRATLLLLFGALPGLAYVPDPFDATPNHRTDFANIQFLVNQNIAAGITNADGKVWITVDSTPMDAVSGAIATWNNIPTSAVHFAPVQLTGLNYNMNDGQSVITFIDDAYTRTFTNGIIGITAVAYFADGRIADTDIFFSPTAQFSTNRAAGTYDLQSVVTHELGHSLGANHTNILSAAMYYATTMQDAHAQSLSADDIAFLSALYPAPGGNGYGTISGTTTVGGAPLFGGAITAIDPFTGITVGGFSSVVDGTYSLQLPPGNYMVYVEPAGNLALYFSNPQSVLFTSFQPAFAGGNAQPTLLDVGTGTSTTADLAASAGASPIKAPFAAIGAAGMIGDYRGTFSSGPLSLSSGQSVDILFGNPLTGTITEANLQVIGGATLRPGSLRRDTGLTLSDGSQVFRFTLDVPPVTATNSATLIIKNGTDILTRSGLFSLSRPQSVNAGSFLGGPVAPGEILSFFGSQLGPPNPTANGGFGSDGTLPTSLGDITVSFDQAKAPLFYVSGNQINLQVPYEVSSQSFTLMTVFYNGSQVAQSTLSVAKSSPGIFVVTNADGSVNGPGSPSAPGAVLVIYGTGTGITSGILRTGAGAPANSTVPATVTLGGKPVTPIYSGLTAGSVGLAQVNIAIPADTAPGNSIPLQFSMNGAASQTVNIAVR